MLCLCLQATLVGKRFIAVYLWCAYAGSSFHIKTEADSNDASEHTLDDDSRSYLCTICHKRFTTKSDLTVHSKTHTGLNVYTCTQCEKRFSSQSSLCNHMNIHVGKHKCTECGKLFPRSRNLVLHSRIHTGEKPYKCSLCNKSFRHHSHLVTHKRGIHSDGRRSNHCPYCGMLFKTNMEQHIRIHTGEKPYSCRHCSECFAFLNQLKAHLLNSHNESTWLNYYSPKV